jgi:N-acetylmuramic acid 6-phosphate etherase
MASEEPNPRSIDIDLLSSGEILRRINAEDALVAEAVGRELAAIEATVDRVVAAFGRGGRLIYAGAGTSGRLGMLDAAECPPTYGTPPDQVVALLAGGASAMTRSIEAAEDDESEGASAVAGLDVGVRDVVVGLAASGRTPYVVGALRAARERGAYTVALAGNRDGPVGQAADLIIAPQTGPEVVAGSTRMKAGTAQKMVLNMISTAALICTGHTYGNLMVDMQSRNSKLQARARAIVAQASGVSPEVAAHTLQQADGEIKTAIVMCRRGVSADKARAALRRAGGVVRRALDDP